MSVIITRERPDTPDAVRLIAALDALVEMLYPSESRHGYSVNKLLAENVAFFVLRVGGVPAGIGGIKRVEADNPDDVAYGEIKRMYVRPEFRGSGYAKQILRHLAEYAAAQGISLLRLETGIHQHEAIGLYERLGFRRIPPFGPYTDDPVSLCYEKQLPL